MKNSNYIISGILFVAVIILFILQFTGRNANMKHSENAEALGDSIGFHLPIAYVRTDSLMDKYKFFTDLNEAFMKKMEDKKLDFNSRTKKLSKDIVDFQQKAQMNAFISAERQVQEQNRLAGLQQELEHYAAQIERELAAERMKLNQQVQDTIIAALKEYNNPKKYELIFSDASTDNILYADDSYNITQEVIEFLNARYVAPTK